MEPTSQISGRVLVVDDDPTIRDLLGAQLRTEGFEVTTVEGLSGLERNLRQRNYDAVLLDLFLDGEDGLTAVPLLIREHPHTKVIIMSAHGTVELAVDAVQQGASGFIAKTKDPGDIVRELKRRLWAERAAELPTGLVSPADLGLIGESDSIRRVAETIDRIKDVDSTVLVTGESGTGKELVARAIHNVSERKTHRFEAINCGAIPATLLESELFGHKRGAFTDAKVERKGIFETVSGGTLLLDEIGEMPIELQVKLLRVLQESQVTPLGSSKAIPVNARVVAATNRNLSDEVKAGRFREDLFFRLAVLTIELPPLRERRSDIPLLARHFLEKLSNKFKIDIAPASPELEARLKAHDWPGNIRELQNAIERGVVLSNDGRLHYENMVHRGQESLSHGREGLSGDHLIGKPLSEAKQDFEKAYLQQLLELTRGNISEIARISGRYRADIYRLLAKHGVEWEEFRP